MPPDKRTQQFPDDYTRFSSVCRSGNKVNGDDYYVGFISSNDVRTTDGKLLQIISSRTLNQQ
jgi:hypothetical protein